MSFQTILMPKAIWQSKQKKVSEKLTQIAKAAPLNLLKTLIAYHLSHFFYHFAKKSYW